MFTVVWDKIYSFFFKLIDNPKQLVIKTVLFITTIVVWAFLTNVTCALILIVLILCHEYGHIWAMKHCGFEVKGVYFIIIGCAAVGGNDKKGGFGDRRDEAFIAIMGPLWGVVSTLIPTAIYLISGNVIWGAIALFNIVLNVFNLLPFASLDGGRIIRAIAFSINNWLGMAVLVLGLGALCWLVVTVNQPLWWALGIFMVFLSINELRYEYLSRHETGRIRMRAGKMIGYFSAYLGLIAFYIFVFIMLISNEAVVLAMESLVQ